MRPPIRYQLFFFLFLPGIIFSQRSNQRWSANLNEVQKVFIENRGQFDREDRGGDSNKILYSARIEGVDIYFTPGSIIYRHKEILMLPNENSEKYDKKVAGEQHPRKSSRKKRVMKTHFLTMGWKNCRQDVRVTGKEKISQYFTYSDPQTIRAGGFRRIVYSNLYPGIDFTFFFPDDKPGIKYEIIARPGSDISLVQMQYSGAKGMFLDNEGNMHIESSFGEFIDHAPSAFYSDGVKTGSSFYYEKETTSFICIRNNPDISLIIDPWITIPSFTGTNRAYDIDWDYSGNVYMYGGEYPFQLVKLNNSGAIQWSFSGNAFDSSDPYYGDFALDRKTGSAFLGEGWHSAQPAMMIKVNSAGQQVSVFSGHPEVWEIWRVAYNSCTNQGVIGIGSNVNPYTAAIFDTNLSSVYPVNFLGSWPTFVDVALLAIDDSNSFFVMAENGITWMENTLVKCPLNSLSPTTYMVNSGHHFTEVSSVIYYPNGSSSYYPNGYNGLAKGKYLYSYDGAILKKWNPSDGSFITSVSVSADSFACGGIAVDNCDNIFLGTISGVSQYDSLLTYVNSVSTGSAVYDVAVGFGGEIIACGNGFVSALSLFSPCNDSASFTLSTDSTNVTCTGNNGTASVTVSGGTPPFNYFWIPGGQTTSTATGLAPGTYIVRVMDSGAVSCNISGFNLDTVVVSAISGFTQQYHTTTGISCFGNNDGSATIYVSGGTTPYTYLWSPGGQTTQSVTGLTGGAYFVTVSDANGCQTKDSMEVIYPNPLTVSPASQDITCDIFFGGYGYILLNASGGTAPYTYLWSSGETTEDLTYIITPGTYCVTVTDSKGCSLSYCDTIESAMPFSVEVINSCGGNNGTIIIHVSWDSLFPGYIAVYDSLYNLISSDTIVTGLPPGTYYVEIYDFFFTCYYFEIIVIGSGSAMAITASFLNPSCYGGNNGIAWISYISGTPPYTYQWSNGGTGSQITGLIAGTYSVTVSDASGCIGMDYGTLINPPQIAVSLSVTNTVCGQNLGSISAAGSGGTVPYSFLWSTGSTGQTLNNLAAGIYFVTLTDGNGCTTADSAGVIGTGSPAIALNSIIHVSCFGNSDGGIFTDVSGGALPYSFLWNNGAVTEDITGLDTGTYSITVTEATGCINTDTFFITQPAAIILSTGSTLASCTGNDGSAWVSVSGETPGYNYLWNTGITNDTLINVNSGTYYITVSDANSCVKTDTITVGITGGPAVTITPIFNITCSGNNDGFTGALPSGGNPPYSYLWSNGSSLSTIDSLPPAIYTVTITDSAGCTSIASATITEPTLLSVSTYSVPAGCTGGGEATAAAAGGTGSYTYLWNTGVETQGIASLQAGIYSVTVTDTNGCTVSGSVNVLLNGFITAGISGNSALCAGQSVQLTASGGGSYLWSTGDTTVTVNAAPIATGFINVVAIEGSCSDTASINIIVYPAVSVNGGNDTTIYIGDHAALAAAVSGGTPAYTYLWMPGNQNIAGITVNPDETTGYIISVVDANDCKAVDTVLVEVRPCDAEVFIPNAFAPDCRCPDEKLFVFSDCIETMEFTIFDRWGEKVFETNEQSKGWDGNFNGKPMNVAVYVYLLEYTTINEPDKTVTVEGNVNLLR